MIEDLTKEKLIEYGFQPETIERLLTWDNYELKIENPKGYFFASNIDGKIYTGIDAPKKYWFTKNCIGFPITHPNLIREYYKLKLERWLNDKKKLLGEMFNEQNSIESFNQSEIKIAKDCINYQIENLKGRRKNSIEIYQSFIDFLETKPQVKEHKIEGPVISLFCSILHQSEILIQGFDESPEKFIERVVDKYSINGTNPKKARQYFNTTMQIKKSDKHYRNVLQQILPNIEPATKNQIINYLQSKNLYA